MGMVLVLVWLMVTTTTLMFLTPQAFTRILLESQVHATIPAPRHHLKLVAAPAIILDTTVTHLTNIPPRHTGVDPPKPRSNIHHLLPTIHLDKSMSTPRIAQSPLLLKAKFLLLRFPLMYQLRLNDRTVYT